MPDDKIALTFALFTPVSPDDPSTSTAWDELGKARARYLRDSDNIYRIPLRRIDTQNRDINALIRDVTKKWNEEKDTRVITVSKL